jgi:hypothetical protein
LDTPPVIKGGRVLIPIRAIAEATGSEVVWDDESHKITITKGDTVIVLTIDDDNVLINGKPYTIDVPAQLMNNRTVVPVRVIFEHLGLHVNWDPDTETVEIE